jgi:hypothetical protein
MFILNAIKLPKGKYLTTDFNDNIMVKIKARVQESNNTIEFRTENKKGKIESKTPYQTICAYRHLRHISFSCTPFIFFIVTIDFLVYL